MTSEKDDGLEIPDFLLVKNRVENTDVKPIEIGSQTAPEFDWDTYFGPGAVCHRLGIPESDDDRANRLQWLKDQEERRDTSLARFEEKRLDQDDADIQQARREHDHKRKLKAKRRSKNGV